MEGPFAGPHVALLPVTQQHLQPGAQLLPAHCPVLRRARQPYRDVLQSQRPALHLQSLGCNPSFAFAQVPPFIVASNLAPRWAVGQQLQALQKQRCQDGVCTNGCTCKARWVRAHPAVFQTLKISLNLFSLSPSSPQLPSHSPWQLSG